MAMSLARSIIGIALGVMLFAGAGLAVETAEVEKFVKARIDIGEMMTSYFQGGERFKEGQRPSPEQMKEMGADIHAKLGKLLAKDDLTVEEDRNRSPEAFADDSAGKSHHKEEQDQKVRDDALPLARTGRRVGTRR